MSNTATLTNYKTQAKQPIVMSKVIINDRQLTVVSDSCSTCFVEHYSINDELLNTLELYKKVIKQSGKQGVKVRYKHGTKRLLTENKDDLVNELNCYRRIYNELCELWRAKLEKGVFSGYCDDTELDSMTRLSHKLTAMNYHGTPIGRAKDINYRLSEIERMLQRKEIASFSI